MSSVAFHHGAALPWTRSPEDERRLRRIMISVLAIMLLLSLVVPMIQIPDRFIDQVQEVPARFARLIVEPKPAPPPPPVQREEIKPQPEPPKAEPVAREEPPPVAEPRRPAETEPPRPTARERASRTGLLALSQELAELRGTSVADDLERRPLQQRAAAAPRAERPVIAAGSGTGSGGIDTSGLARDTGDTRLAGRETTRVEGPAGSAADDGARAQAARGALSVRTTEEIQMIFDQNKGALNALYNRALRVNPGLAGKIVLRLTIEPGGQVVDCALVSSELGDPELERRLVARVQLFNFGAKDVAATTITYPIDFFPG